MAAIDARGLVKHYRQVTALDGLDLAVPGGAVFGLVGPNGAGKTTTFSILCGFVRPDAGEATVLGTPVREVFRLKGRLSALPQDALLPPHDPVLESLVFFGKLLGWDRQKAKAEARRALELTGMSEWAKARGGALSHGMAKRVGLAQAFLGEPELVLLDEPTAGLDPVAAAQVRDLIRSLKGRSTVVISSHNLHEVEELCDAAAIISRGRVVQAGSMATITAANAQVRFVLGREPPLDRLKALPTVADAEWDPERRLLVARFPDGRFEAEQVIADVLRLLLAEDVPVSGVAKGRRLEERVLEIT
jgi:ABC-type multidrug transport system ATPase subunit